VAETMTNAREGENNIPDKKRPFTCRNSR